MARYKCVMEYDGEKYAGFQIQPNAITVQECTENALSSLFGQNTKITASGRTDSGVSARGQVIHFDSNTDIPADKIPFALKSLLPNDIAILSCTYVNDDFHARFSAKSKTYSYNICLTKINRPLYKKYYQYPYNIDIDLLKLSLLKLKGKHNFKAFMSTGS
ncbi:MAG: tRNA pseudouridine(38-40) synthase TruA, partial [Clostridia bacterium]|nr:tRNA pseudouridine(38-40) synthase TruA [Clostridia bacterium]